MIQLAGVNKYFGQNHVLKDISLKVESGEKVVVIGPSGSGKSTMIRCMNHLEEPDSGTVTVDGIEITAPGAPIRAVRQKVAMVFQQFNLYPHKTVLENLTIAPILVQGIKKKKQKEPDWNFSNASVLKKRLPPILHNYQAVSSSVSLLPVLSICILRLCFLMNRLLLSIPR